MIYVDGVGGDKSKTPQLRTEVDICTKVSVIWRVRCTLHISMPSSNWLCALATSIHTACVFECCNQLCELLCGWKWLSHSTLPLSSLPLPPDHVPAPPLHLAV